MLRCHSGWDCCKNLFLKQTGCDSMPTCRVINGICAFVVPAPVRRRLRVEPNNLSGVGLRGDIKAQYMPHWQ
eukprot:6802798-Pyramimonas_sp.AAC.1